MKESGYINSKLLNALGGKKETVRLNNEDISLVSDGAYLWGVEDHDKGRGVFNHVMLTARSAYYIGRELKDKQIPNYEDLNLPTLVNAAILHDVIKLAGEDREKLTAEQKVTLGLPENFREIMDEADEIGVDWLKNAGFPPEVYEAISAHDFPLRIVDDPYWKIILVADYMSGQKIMTVKDRLDDVRTRWIDEQVENGKSPRIEPDRFDIAGRNIKQVAGEIFGALEMEDQEFIDVYDLNSYSSMQRWEKFLRDTREAKTESAKNAVRLVERVADSGNYGKIKYHDWRESNSKSDRTPSNS